MRKGNFCITSRGNFLKSLTMPNRVKKIIVDFEEAGVYPWSMEVHKDLSDRIGVYVIENTKGEIIYVGEATGVGGLKERHAKHEKKELFRLFNASKLVVYYVTGASRDDAGKVALLERILIYGNEPILNDDIKQPIPTAYFIAKEIKRQLIIIIKYYSMFKDSLAVKDEEVEKHLEVYNKLLTEITELYDKTKELDESIKKLHNEIKKQEKNILSKKKSLQSAEKRLKKGEILNPKSVSRKKRNLDKKIGDLKNIKQVIKDLNLDLKDKKNEFSTTFKQLNDYTKVKDNIKPVNDGFYLYNTVKAVTQKMQNI